VGGGSGSSRAVLRESKEGGRKGIAANMFPCGYDGRGCVGSVHGSLSMIRTDIWTSKDRCHQQKKTDLDVQDLVKTVNNLLRPRVLVAGIERPFSRKAVHALCTTAHGICVTTKTSIHGGGNRHNTFRWERSIGCVIRVACAGDCEQPFLRAHLHERGCGCVFGGSFCSVLVDASKWRLLPCNSHMSRARMELL
jgi:hypothetical protein